MSEPGDEGFVLPYVLAVIAVLAIATSIAAERLQRSTHILSAMQDQSRIERQFSTAEAEAVYSLITGIPMERGVDLNPKSPIASEFGFMMADGSFRQEAPDEGAVERDIWDGQGGQRVSIQSNERVYIELRDVSGLVSLSAGPRDDTIRVLTELGLSKNTARTLSARLADYTDADNNRQFKGAERADYRLRDKVPPTNSPLRNYDELSHVLGWEDTFEKIDVNRLKKMTSLQPVSKLRKQFASPKLLGILGLDNKETAPMSGEFDIADLEALNSMMSGISRLSFWVKDQTGLYHKRVIEIERGANNVEKPFRRFWVYETTMLKDDLDLGLDSIDEIKNVIHAASVRLP